MSYSSSFLNHARRSRMNQTTAYSMHKNRLAPLKTSGAEQNLCERDPQVRGLCGEESENEIGDAEQKKEYASNEKGVAIS